MAESGSIEVKITADSEEFVGLARHHLECEKIAERMAELLRPIPAVIPGRRSAQVIEQVLADWDAHQWP